MSTLAEIGKAGDVLRGSDLSDFNEVHPRDEGGRFALKGSGGGLRDPRMARRKRRLRRIGRVQATQRAEVAAATPLVSKPPLQRLSAIRRPAERKAAERKPMTMSERAEAKKDWDVSLDDVSQVKDEEKHRLDEQQLIPVTADQAAEFAKTGRLAVGAATKRWGHELMSLSPQEAEEYAQQEAIHGDPDSLVFIQVDRAWVIEQTGEGGTLASAMLISSTVSDDSDPAERYNGMLNTNVVVHGDEEEYVDDTVAIPIMYATAHDWVEVRAGRKDDFRDWQGVAKADDWDAEEHPRGAHGQFTSVAHPRDPRMARTRRRRRRLARTAMAQAAPAPVEDMRVSERMAALRRPAERRAADRHATRYTTAHEKPLPREHPQELPRDSQSTPPPPRKTPPKAVSVGEEGTPSGPTLPKEYIDAARAAQAQADADENEFQDARAMITAQQAETGLPAVKVAEQLGYLGAARHIQAGQQRAAERKAQWAGTAPKEDLAAMRRRLLRGQHQRR
jgi:hypothetical protein